jgi:dephospho-CoA kinase
MGRPARQPGAAAVVTRAVAVGVAGRIGSGKTTLASELATRIGCPLASFGEFVRSVARTRNLESTDRTILQDLGDELIAEGWKSFVDAVLIQAGYSSGPVVIDGIRHRSAIETLRSLLEPTPLVVVAVDISDDERRERLRERGLESDDINSADAHANESEVDAVIRAADLVVPAHLSVDDTCSTVMEWISSS